MNGLEDGECVSGPTHLKIDGAKQTPCRKVLGIDIRRAPAVPERTLVIAGQIPNERSARTDDETQRVELHGAIDFADRLRVPSKGGKHGRVSAVRVLLA